MVQEDPSKCASCRTDQSLKLQTVNQEKQANVQSIAASLLASYSQTYDHSAVSVLEKGLSAPIIILYRRKMSWLPLVSVNAKPHPQSCDRTVDVLHFGTDNVSPPQKKKKKIGPLHILMKTNQSALHFVLVSLCHPLLDNTESHHSILICLNS